MIAALRKSAGFGEGLYSALPTNGGAIHVISLHQRSSADHRWGSRETMLIDMLHPELLWLDSSIARKNEPSEAALPPRQKQTLQLLLKGMSEKQISASLQLSVHTVHVYVKSIYRTFRVSTRSELLAKWVDRPE